MGGIEPENQFLLCGTPATDNDICRKFLACLLITAKHYVIVVIFEKIYPALPVDIFSKPIYASPKRLQMRNQQKKKDQSYAPSPR